MLFGSDIRHYGFLKSTSSFSGLKVQFSLLLIININLIFLHEQGSKEIEERSPEKEKRKAKLRGDERKERKMNRKRVSLNKNGTVR